MEKVIVYAFPVFGLLMAAEFALGLARGRNNYRLNDTLSSLSQGLLSQITLLFTNFLHVGVFTLAAASLALWHAPQFWRAWYGWLAALVLVDFCGYWVHRCSHERSILWAAHVVHHQSQAFNFSTALRQESAYPLLSWIFYLPLALMGMPPEEFAVAWLAVLLYQVWIHTEHVGKLGWLEWIFATPSNHRVHHAVNDCYIDRNYGGWLIIWDRIFGTYAQEGPEPCVYGTRPSLDSWDPLRANLVIYGKLLRDSWRTRRCSDKLRIWFEAPAWRPADVARDDPRPAFDITQVRVFDPPVARGALALAAVQFLALAGASAALLWYADELGRAAAFAWVAGITAGLWVIGRVLQDRLGLVQALLADALIVLALAAASGAVTKALSDLP